jgi:membrane protease subunit HflC
MRRMMIGIFTAAVLLVLFVVLCTFVRRPYEKVLLNRFGSLIEENSQWRLCYNWYLKLPTDGVLRFDTRLHLYPGPLKEMPTAGSELVSVRTFAAWRIVDPVKFYKNTGGSDERAQSMIDQIIQGLVPGKIVKHKLDELFNADESKIRTGEIEAEIATDATEDVKNPDGTVKTPGLRAMGIQMAEIGFSRMAFAPANAGNVYERMVAELNKRAIAYQTEGIAQANIIRAEGKQAAEKERAEAVRQAQQIRGQGDAEANRILAQVQTTPQAVEFYQYWKSLDFLKSSLAKNTVLVLSSDSDILKGLFQAPKSGQFTPAAPAPAAPGAALKIVPLNVQTRPGN